MLQSSIIGCLLVLLFAAPAFAQRDSASVPSGPSTDLLPILSYDTDTGFGFGAKVFLLNHVGLRESFDVVLFNSTKGERWYRLVVSLPDFELRQGKSYPLAIDLLIDYDKWIANGYFGIGNGSRFADRENYTREPFEASLTVSRGFTTTTVGQIGVRFKVVRFFNFEEGSRLAALPSGLYLPRASAISAFAVVRYDTRSSFINPTSGIVLQGEVEHAPEQKFNDVSFTRIGGWLQYYHPILDPEIVIALRLGLQSISGSNIPVQFLLPMGGNATLRGSPQDRFLDKVAALANIEFRFPIVWRFGGVAGMDAGKVWGDVSKTDLVRWATNPTIGLRLHMDTFVVRLDVGFGVETTGLYLNFGQIF